MNLAKILMPVNKPLEAVENLLDNCVPADLPVREHVAYVIGSKGKRLRPALVLLTGGACGTLGDRHIRVAAIIELIHTATLVHDDVVDGAQSRRKKDTLNHKLGSDIPILIGDWIFSRAFTLISVLKIPEVSYELADMATRICDGEMSQLLRKKNYAITENEYLSMIENKTASLFSSACRLGAFLSGRDMSETGHFVEYGRQLGTAFQLIDDCLDITGEESVIGKSLGTDFKNGKATMPFLYLIQEFSKSYGTDAVEFLFEMTPYTTLMKLLEEHRVLDRTVKLAQQYTRAAKEELSALQDSPYKQSLLRIADYVIGQYTHNILSATPQHTPGH